MGLPGRITFEEEMKKNPELKKADIDSLREWYNKQPHLPKISDSELALFLHSNYYLMEPTKTTIDYYFTYRTHIPEFFAERDPIGCKSLRYSMVVAAQCPLQMHTKEGYKIVYSRLLDYEASHYVYNDSIKYFMMVVDVWLRTEGTGKGHIILIDMVGVVLGHVGRLSPLGLKKVLVYLQDALPVRLKGLHFVNTNAIMDLILNMARPFMKKELLEVLHLHPTVDTLAKFMPIEALPNELGGKAGPITELHKAHIKTIEEHRPYFLEDEQTGRVNESMRPGKSKNVTDLFGVEGSFKKLEID